MRARMLAQVHCPNVVDHEAHNWVVTMPGAGPVDWQRCLGRYTPRRYRAPKPVPRIPEDPFAGIPGTEENEE